MPNAAAPGDDGLLQAPRGRVARSPRDASPPFPPLDNRDGENNPWSNAVAGRANVCRAGAAIQRRAVPSAKSVVWLLLGSDGLDPGGLTGLLVGDAIPRPLTPGLLDEARGSPPEVVVAADAALSPGDAAAWLSLEVALVLIVPEERVAAYHALADTHPVIALASPSAECLRLALASAAAERRRLLFWKGEAERLRRRLEDRIVIERAKGVLVRLWGATEEQAYKRLQAYARQNRKQIREVAQALLESHALLGPAAAAMPLDPAATPVDAEAEA